VDTRIVTSLAGLDALGPSWRALEETQPDLPFSCTFDYVAAWARARLGTTELAVVVAEDQGQLVGVLPLGLTTRRKGPVSVLEVAFLTEGDRRDAVLDARRVSPGTTVKALLAAAFALDAKPRRVSLRYLPAHSPLTHHLLQSTEHNPQVRPLVELPLIELARHGSFAEYRRTIPRSVIRRANKMRRELGMRVEVESPVSESLFDELVAQHRRQQQFLIERHGRRDRRSLFDDPVRERAYRMITVGNPGALAFVARTSAGELLFHDLAWRRGATVTAWNTAYNPDFAHHRPSRARLDAIEWLYEDGGVRVFDLGAGRYPWKFELTPAFELAYDFAAWQGDDTVGRVLRKLKP